MTQADHRTRSVPDAHEIAGAARSVLACADSVNLVVDGVADVLEGDADLGDAGPARHPHFLSRWAPRSPTPPGGTAAP